MEVLAKLYIRNYTQETKGIVSALEILKRNT